jgi:hypothetical protein
MVDKYPEIHKQNERGQKAKVKRILLNVVSISKKDCGQKSSAKS